MIHAQLSTSSDLVIDPTTATNTAASALTFKQTLDPDPGRGEVNNAATWDDFPNGRFGDYKSPAFGAQDQWGGTGFSVRILFLSNADSVLTVCAAVQGS
jgi:methylenetetrahydrofolate reductase (NADPH)